MKTFTFINCTGADAFQVHKAGCRDIGKVRKNGQWDVEAETVEQAIDREVADFQANEMSYTAGDFRVLPCVKGA